MSSAVRYWLALLPLIVLGVGLRLMFYGFQGLVSSPADLGLELLGLLAGLVCFVAGIVGCVFLFSAPARKE
jgi:hypothetical protein